MPFAIAPMTFHPDGMEKLGVRHRCRRAFIAAATQGRTHFKLRRSVLINHPSHVGAAPFDEEAGRTPWEAITAIEPPLRGLPKRLLAGLVKGTVQFKTVRG